MEHREPAPYEVQPQQGAEAAGQPQRSARHLTLLGSGGAGLHTPQRHHRLPALALTLAGHGEPPGRQYYDFSSPTINGRLRCVNASILGCLPAARVPRLFQVKQKAGPKTCLYCSEELRKQLQSPFLSAEAAQPFFDACSFSAVAHTPICRDAAGVVKQLLPAPGATRAKPPAWCNQQRRTSRHRSPCLSVEVGCAAQVSLLSVCEVMRKIAQKVPFFF